MENQIREVSIKIQNEERIDDKIIRKINEYPKIRFGLLLVTLIGMNYYLFWVGTVHRYAVNLFLKVFLFAILGSLIISKKSTLTGKIIECMEGSWLIISSITLLIATSSKHLNLNTFECILAGSLWFIGVGLMMGTSSIIKIPHNFDIKNDQREKLLKKQ